MTTLITGAGLVGSLVAARITAHGDERPILYDVNFSMDNLRERLPLDRVELVRGDVMEVGDLVRALKAHRVRRIIHTAGFLTSAVRERPVAGVRVNLMGTLNVFEAARLAEVERVVFCSSNTVYRGSGSQPEGGALREDVALRAVSEHPPSVYASMKLAAEWLGHCYTAEYGLDVASVRFGGVFGPWRGTPSGGPTRLMQQLIENTYRGLPARIGARDLQTGMDYVYASDAAQGATLAAFAPRLQGRVYNVSMGRLYRASDLLPLVARRLGREVVFDTSEAAPLSGYSREIWPADLCQAEQELGYRVEFPMEAAIDDYAAWLERSQAR